MVANRVDRVMMLKVVQQVTETLQEVHAAGISHSVTCENVYVDLSQGSVRVTLMNLGLDSITRSVESDIAQLGVLIT